MKAMTYFLLSIPAVLAGADPIFGPNLVPNADFEEWADGKPAAWNVGINPANPAKFSADPAFKVTGKFSLKLELPSAGNVSFQSAKPLPVEGGAKYLFSLAYRSEGFGEKGKYSGVDSSARLIWLDKDGKQIGSGGILALPYHPMAEWDLRDTIAEAPVGAVSVIIGGGFNNSSEKQTGKNIPSALWIDAVRLLRYSPPPDPEAAGRKVEKIVEGGWDNSIVKSYNLPSLLYSKVAVIVSDSESTDGTCLKALTTEGKGIMAHSPYFTSARPGLYRAVLRARNGNVTGGKAIGSMYISSEESGGRGEVSICPFDFKEADKYRDFSVDFILRANGWWDFVVMTEGTAEWFIDTVRVYPLKYFNDDELLGIYPGMEGLVPENLVPGASVPCSALVLAGPLYDCWRIADALHIGQIAITPVFIRGGRNQTFAGFPGKPEDLFKHRLIILCDIDVQSLSLKQKNMIKEFANKGGGLVFLGGHKAFDRGGIQNSLLADLLPVTFDTASDAPLVGNGRPAKLAKTTPHPATEFLGMDNRPACYWWHGAKAKEGTDTIISLENGDPAVVAGKFGKGRVCCIMMTCHGDPAKGEIPFWNWSEWPILLRDLSWWTTGQYDFKFK